MRKPQIRECVLTQFRKQCSILFHQGRAPVLRVRRDQLGAIWSSQVQTRPSINCELPKERGGGGADFMDEMSERELGRQVMARAFISCAAKSASLANNGYQQHQHEVMGEDSIERPTTSIKCRHWNAPVWAHGEVGAKVQRKSSSFPTPRAWLS